MLIDTNSKTFPTKYKRNDTEYAKGWNACLNSVLQHPACDVEQLLDFAASYIAKFILLCSVPKKQEPMVFRKLHVGIGDYKGSGYAFVDAFNRIYDEYITTVPESFHNIVSSYIDELTKENHDETLSI